MATPITKFALKDSTCFADKALEAKGVAKFMEALALTEDAVWTKALEKLSQVGNLNHFYRLPRQELNALMKKFGTVTTYDMGNVFKLIQTGKFETLDTFLEKLPEERIFAMLLVLGRSMKCWLESESTEDNKRVKRWKVANA